MSDEVMLEGKSFVSAKRASEMSGYARDYIGQLARGGLIAAQRVGGLWYISLDSLTAYQKNADSFTPVQPQKPAQQDLDSIVSFDGKDYVSASKAAKLTSYNQDYVGQLARAGKILSRQIGNRWYVERAGLLAHKAQKDALLGAVQAEAVGLVRNEKPVTAPVSPYTPVYAQEPLMKYIPEHSDLMPALKKKSHDIVSPEPMSVANQVPIHVVRVSKPMGNRVRSGKAFHKRGRSHGNTMIRAAQIGVALTFVIVLSYGLVSFKDNSMYTINATGDGRAQNRSSLTASLGGVFDWLLAGIENVVSPRIDYIRIP